MNGNSSVTSKSSGLNSNSICYIWSEELLSECDRLPAVPERASMVHGLIKSYELLSKLTVIRARCATVAEIREFHAESYVQHLKDMSQVHDDYEVNEQDEEVGIGYDCTPIPDLYTLVSHLAGGTVTAALALQSGARVAINWCGGWHHAQRFEAEGFCYVNDIVIGIEKLRKRFPKVLYVDLDVHHGNGVEEAYSISKSVFTLSFHKHEPGFYPGSGSIDDIGSLAGKGYACNFPYRDGLSDTSLIHAFNSVFPLIVSRFEPLALVVQCGADVLASDPLGGANVTPHGVCHCVRTVLAVGKPTILLGGGGYNKSNSARLWTRITAEVIGEQLSDDIPDNEYFTRYGPGYDLDVPPTNRKDCNDKTYLDQCIQRIRENVEKYLPASKPS